MKTKKILALLALTVMMIMCMSLTAFAGKIHEHTWKYLNTDKPNHIIKAWCSGDCPEGYTSNSAFVSATVSIDFDSYPSGDLILLINYNSGDESLNDYGFKPVEVAIEGIGKGSPGNKKIVKDAQGNYSFNTSSEYNYKFIIHYKSGDQGKLEFNNVSLPKGSSSISGDVPAAAEGLKYTGNALSLITGCEAIGGTMMYKVSGDNNWSKNIPTRVDAGEYEVLYMVSGDASHQNYIPDNNVIIVSIDKVDATIANEPASLDAVYNGEEQVLISAGSTNDGTLLYRLSGEAEYQKELPKAKDAGEYDIEVTVSGDKNHNNSGDSSVKATILPREITITADDKSKTEGCFDPELTYTVTSGDLGSGDTLDDLNITINREIGETSGDYIITVSGENSNYNITSENGTFTIIDKNLVVVPSGDTDTSETSLNGLEKLFNQDKYKANSGDEVKIAYDVEEKDPDSGDVAVLALQELTGNKETEYYDIKIEYYVNGEKSGDITDTNGEIIEIKIKKANASSKKITIKRFHDINENKVVDSGEIQALTQIYSTNNKADGTFIVYSDYVVIYATKFSTYSISTSNKSVPAVSSGTSYSITVSKDIEDGTVKVSDSTAKADEKITITVKPDEGYAVKNVVVKDNNDRKITVKDAGNNKYTFTMPSRKVTVYAEFEKIEEDVEIELPFEDVSDKNWFYDAVKYVYENGYMNGISDVLFAPNAEITRAQVITTLWRLDGQKYTNYYMSFNDVAFDVWYTEAIRWAASENIVNGYDDTTFGTNDIITREQLATILYRYAQYKGVNVNKLTENINTLSYDDIFDVSDWASAGTHFCLATGLIQGMDDGTIAPKSYATRAQFATIIMRAVEIF